MQKLFRVTVDISKKIPAPAFEVNTNDLKSVKLEITITNGQTLLDLTGVTPRINIRKPDNEVIFQDCEIADAKAGKVQIVLENQAYLVPGTHTAEIACYKGSEITAITGTFSYKSIKGIMNDQAVESKSEFTAIDRKLVDVQEILEDVRENGTGIDAQARKDLQNVTTQLADTSQIVEKETKERLSGGRLQPMISFIDDDNKKEFMTKLKPIADSKGIKFTLAVMTGSVGNSSSNSLATLKQLQAEGHVIASHGVTGAYIRNATEEVAIQECRDSRQWLKDNGFNGYDYHIYSGGCDMTDYRTQNISRRFFKASFATNGTQNYPPLSQACINRYDYVTRALEDNKALVDACLATNSWLIFYTHSNVIELDNTKLAELRELIDYIKSKSIDIVTVIDGIERYGNVVETVDDAGIRTAISKVGLSSMGASSDQLKFLGNITDLNSKTLTDYPINSISVHNVPNSGANRPSNSWGGMVVTIRTSDIAYSTQLYITMSREKNIWQRYWSSGSSSWSDWVPLKNNLFGTGTGFDKPITDYPKETVSINNYPNGTATATAPVPSRGGVLTTYRLPDDTYSYQTYKEFSGTKIYVRNWSNSNSAWGAWST